jgi:hypothetical protein
MERGLAVVVAHQHSDERSHDHDGDHPSDSAREGHDAHPDKKAPCGPNHDEQNDCSCGKHDSKMLTGAKPSVEPPVPALIAILDWVLTTERIPLAQITINRHDVWATARPPTSLLRLHCALVV